MKISRRCSRLVVAVVALVTARANAASPQATQLPHPAMPHAVMPHAVPTATSIAASIVPGHAPLFDPATLSLRTLPNGVRAIVKETRGTGVVSAQVWVRAGGRYETGANNGVSHLIETLAMRASKNYPRPPQSGTGGGVQDAIEGVGGVADSQTTRDATNYSATVAAVFLPSAMRALSDAVLQPSLADSDVDGGKTLVQQELVSHENDPLFTTANAANLAYALAFTKHPYRRPPTGTPASMEILNGSLVRSYYHSRYVGPNITVVIVGDVEREIGHALIARYFGAAPAGKASPPSIAVETAPTTFKTGARHRLVANTTIALAFGAPGIHTPEDVVAMDVLLAHWREGHDAVLRRVLLGPETDASDTPGDSTDTPKPSVEPLALGFDVDFLTQQDPSLLIISLLVDVSSQQAAVDATLKQIDLVRRNGISEADLARAKAILSQQYVEQSETVTRQAGALGFYDMIDSYEFAATYLDRIAHVSTADVARIANKYLSNTAYVQAAIEPAPRPPSHPGGDDGSTITASANLDGRDRMGQ